MGKNKIVFIVSAGHSGSTILTKILGQHSKVFPGSELVNINNSSVRSNISYCSCGVPYSDCDFWPTVGDKIDINDLHLFRTIKSRGNIIDYLKLILSLIFNYKFNSKTVNKDIEKYLGLYDVLFKESDDQIIVDASKNIFNALIIASQKKYDHYFIFLKRDGRAVLNSYMKNYYKVELNGKSTFHYSKTHRKPEDVTSYWVKQNLFGIMLKFFRIRKLISIKHEDIVLNSEAKIRQICDQIGVEYEDELTDFYRPDHLFGGNASRINTKKLEKVDMESWRTKLKTEQLKAFSLKARIINYILGYK